MIETFLDGRPLAPASTFALALADACERAVDSGRLVVEVTLDGVAVDPAALEAGGPWPAGRRADFISAVPQDLARYALEAAAAALDEIKPRHRAAAEGVRDGNLDPALAELSGVLTTWTQAKAALERSAELLNVGPQTGNAEWETISPALASLAGRLAEIKRSLVARDWAGLADVLEYDMDEQAVGFADVLRGLARSAVKTSKIP